MTGVVRITKLDFFIIKSQAISYVAVILMFGLIGSPITVLCITGAWFIALMATNIFAIVVLPSFVSALSGVFDFAQSHKELFAFACILTSCIIQFVSYHIAVIFYRKQR